MSEQLYEQLDWIKQMNRTANETQVTSNNIVKELGDQREKMNRQADIVSECHILEQEYQGWHQAGQV